MENTYTFMQHKLRIFLKEKSREQTIIPKKELYMRARSARTVYSWE